MLFRSGTTPNLQQVTDVGNNTTNDIRLDFYPNDQRGVYLYDLDNLNNKVFFGIDGNNYGQVRYYVTGAVNTNIGIQFENARIIETYEGNHGIGLYLDFTNTIYKFGDYNHNYLYTTFVIDDAIKEIRTEFTYGAFGFISNPDQAWLGDGFGNRNSTYISINDLAQRLEISANLISGTAGGSSGQHLKITVGGTDYKIALLNP